MRCVTTYISQMLASASSTAPSSDDLELLLSVAWRVLAIADSASKSSKGGEHSKVAGDACMGLLLQLQASNA
jgi:hypothetical protein